MSFREILLNGGGPDPRGLSPRYRETILCDRCEGDLCATGYTLSTAEGDGRDNVARVLASGRNATGYKHLCESCADEILAAPLCPECRGEMEETKRRGFVCINEECPRDMPQEPERP